MKRFALLIVALAMAGCSPKPTPHVVKALTKPPIEVSHGARQVLQQIAADQKLGDAWWLRLDLVWGPDPQIVIQMVREPPGENDVVYDADGIRCAMPGELTTYLKGVRIDWVDEKPKGRFHVSFDNQSPDEREAGRRWLREQEERRKSAVKDSKPTSK